MSRLADQLSLFHQCLDVSTKLKHDFSKQRLDFFFMISAMLSILALELPNQILLYNMMVAQLVWTIPFTTILLQSMMDDETRVMTRGVVWTLTGWIVLRFTYGLALLEVNHRIALHIILCIQGLIFLQGFTFACSKENFNARLVKMALVTCLAPTFLIALLPSSGQVISCILVVQCIAFAYFSCQNLYDPKIFSCYCILPLSALCAGSLLHAIVWPMSQWAPVHPFLILWSAGHLLFIKQGHSAPIIILLCMWSFVCAFLLPSWFCLSILAILPQLWL